MSLDQSKNDAAQSPYVNWTSDQARQHLLLDIARRFKGIDAEVDAKVDAHAELIAGRPGVKRIPGTLAGEPRVPLYMEGEPGVGKTTLIRAAIQEFCKIAGLRFVENPADDYVFGPKDFYYVTVNLSGKNNPMDIGGLPSKGELETQAGLQARRRATDAGEWLLQELASRTKAMGALCKLQVIEGKEYANGGLRHFDMTLKGEQDGLDLVVNQTLRQLGDEVKKHGVGLNVLKDGEEAVDGRLYLQIKRGTAGTRITAIAPERMAANVEYVSEMLPNRRFAMATKTKFSLFNFDDVANASEAVRNVLLEVAQSNRYSGVMDIGNAMVTFTGNMGAEDNTNIQSEQSDAEVTRVFKVRVTDTPKDWARRIATKYSEQGDCLFSAFIHHNGHNPGIFRDAIGDMRTQRGQPKPNSRSLENALAKVLPYFVMAREMEASPTVFSPEIETVVKGTCGPTVAASYKAFMTGMLTEAIPLAEQLIGTGKLDEEKFNKHMGSKARTSQMDFGFRFCAALADAFVNRVAFSEDARAAAGNAEKAKNLLAESMDRMCTGLAQVEPGEMNYALSRMMARLGGIAKLGSHDGVDVKLTQATYEALADGFARARARNVWPDAEAAKNDFTKIVAGSNLSGSSSKKSSRP